MTSLFSFFHPYRAPYLKCISDKLLFFSFFPAKKNTRMSLGELHSANKTLHSKFSATLVISLYQNPNVLGEAYVCKSQEAFQARH